MLNPNGKPFTVSEITRKIKALLEGNIGLVEITGELSNVRPPSANGHMYFTIKDATAQLGAVVYANTLRTLSVRPENGALVTVTGEISVYAQRGTYQITIRKMTPVGRGDLMEKFEAMKRKLEAEGLFDQAHKRPLPSLPRHIGIVTAPTGAAIRDMINVLTRRYPNLDILIAPAKVQGEGAAETIASGIEALNKVGDPNGNVLPDYPRRDVIIVGRGGGSLEDLWAFNEEVVARAVYNSNIPIISGVGHEIDFSICDFTADYRAPTPSAAAEVVIGRKSDFLSTVDVLRERMLNSLRHRYSDVRGRLKAVATHRVFSEPTHAVESYAQHLDYLAARSVGALETTVSSRKQTLSRLKAAIDIQQSRRLPELQNRIGFLFERSSRALDKRLDAVKNSIETSARQLSALSPVAVLERGYSITLLDNGKALRNPEEAPSGTKLTTRLAHGKKVISYVDGAKHKKAATPANLNPDQLQLLL